MGFLIRSAWLTSGPGTFDALLVGVAFYCGWTFLEVLTAEGLFNFSFAVNPSSPTARCLLIGPGIVVQGLQNSVNLCLSLCQRKQTLPRRTCVSCGKPETDHTRENDCCEPAAQELCVQIILENIGVSDKFYVLL